ncbi:MAG: sigma-70 family RNA polymerase sigma factor [Sphingopyxis sp.]|nr:sigma-70 family RNA polymerase sigma factor [Sphingopyxis sp.]
MTLDGGSGADAENLRLAAIASGDRAAMKQLYDDHYAGLVRFVEGRVNGRIEAADVVHETFIDVWRHAARFEGRSSVKTWIYSIARNKSLDKLRRVGREEQLGDDFDAPDLDADVEAAAEAAHDAQKVRECVAKLGQAHRRMIELAFFEDLSYAEISQIEDIAEGTVKTRIFHAKRLLMHCLGRRAAAV